MTIYIVLLATATASLYLKVIEGRVDQRPPSWLGLLCLYGLLMAAMARDRRCRIAYLSFGVLIAVTFSRNLVSEHPVAAGLVEVISSLVLLMALRSLGDDRHFLSADPVLESDARNPNQILEDSDAQVRAGWSSGRGARHEPGSGQGEGGEGNG